MSKAKKTKNISAILLVILLLLLVLGGVGYMYYNTGGFKTAPKTLYLTNDNKILNDKILEINEAKDCKIKIIDLFYENSPNYTVEILPNPKTANFQFKMKGYEDMYSFHGSEYSTGFNVQKNIDSFTIFVEKWNILDIISKNYDDNPIEILGDYEFEYIPYFIVVVGIRDKIIQFELTAKLESIDFDKDGVVYD